MNPKGGEGKETYTFKEPINRTHGPYIDYGVITISRLLLIISLSCLT